ncbi:MAG: cell division protein MraZ [Firmicutes bacterium ADurb.Bin080]|jgi:MraZ protein|nr:division/cell wall cluster transcriptional repressor MraZ [Clostridiales bacterium]OQC16506.1 MAG: cell division protein MraZ [Firmicutes bacterium ADurb.Bin080]
MFFGEYRLQLDDKNRMRIPNKLREFIVGEYYLLHGTNGCLFVMPAEEFQRIAEKIDSIPISNLKAQDAARKIMASVVIPDEDSQGRFILPKKARDFAEIEKKIVFIGVNKRIEIWSEERYIEKGLDISANFDSEFVALNEYQI